MNSSDLEIAYRNYSKSLYLYAFSLTKSEADAKDLVSEAYLRAFTVVEDNENIYAWLVRVVRNLWIDSLRKKKHLLDEGQYAIEWIEDPSDVFEKIIKHDRVKWLYQEIYKLERKEREIMLMSLTMDLKDEEIANIMHLTTENVRVIRYRVKNKLKEGIK